MFVGKSLHVRRILGQNNTWQLEEPLVWKEINKDAIAVPKGFIFDFASVPRLFAGFIPKVGYKYDRASCLHDWLYMTQLFERSECDRIFVKAMKMEKVSWFKRRTMYWMVRLFGGFVWKRHTLEDINKMRRLGGYLELQNLK